jgi:hypothetical protein
MADCENEASNNCSMSFADDRDSRHSYSHSASRSTGSWRLSTAVDIPSFRSSYQAAGPIDEEHRRHSYQDPIGCSVKGYEFSKLCHVEVRACDKCALSC